MPAEDVTLIAVFVPNTFDLFLTAEPAEGGTVNGEGSYTEGAEITLTATPNEGYTFLKWTDDQDVEVGTEASFIFTMPGSNVTLIAHFDPETSINETEMVSVNIFPNPAGEHFSVESTAIIRSIAISDITGKIVYNGVVGNTRFRLDRAFDSGIYILHIQTDEGVFVRKLQVR